MSRLFETIKVQNKTLQNIDSHNARMNKSRFELFGAGDTIDLREQIILSSHLSTGVYKFRVLYSQTIESVLYFPYAVKQVRTLQLVECNSIEYHHKYTDRKSIDLLTLQSAADDIVIVKNGSITDTSYANIVFFDGQRWVTPSTPLLRGTKRESLMKENIIFEQPITKDDLRNFKKAVLINAMLDFTNSPVIEIGNIRWHF